MSTTAARAMGDDTGRREASAAARLLAEHGPTLGRVCMALLGETAEVDLALAQIARDAGRGRPPAEGARAWLFGLARAACATRRSRMPRPSSTGQAPPTERDGGDRAEVVARTRLASLRPTERDAVVLHLVGGLDLDELATACEVDRQTVRARLGQGLALLVEGSAR